MTDQQALHLWSLLFCVAYRRGQSEARRLHAFRRMNALEAKYPAIVPTEQERFTARVGLVERAAQKREAAAV